jgi:hypothetical protein
LETGGVESQAVAITAYRVAVGIGVISAQQSEAGQTCGAGGRGVDGIKLAACDFSLVAALLIEGEDKAVVTYLTQELCHSHCVVVHVAIQHILQSANPDDEHVGISAARAFGVVIVVGQKAVGDGSDAFEPV